MRVEILGPVRVEVDGADRTPGGKRERALLALLALTPREVVTAEDAADALWGSLAPPDRGAAVSALADRLREACGAALVADVEGVRLDIADDDVDAVAFKRLTERASDEAAEQALRSLDEALALWRGPALAGVDDVPFARAVVADLTERRLAAVEDRAEALLLHGRSGQVAEELRTATREHPTRERLWGQLMTALHREHRTEEALEVYAEARASLADELGIEPGEALQRIEAAILLEDPGRDPAYADAPVPREAARLPVPRTPTYGRDDLVDQVCRAFEAADTRLVTLTGLGGSGKTRVATVAAARLRDATGRDVLFREVTERESADELVAAVAALAAGPDPDHPEGVGPLVVLDNVDASPEGGAAVARLLTETPSVALLVTSRVPLRLAAEHAVAVSSLAVPAPGATAAEIAASPAVELFARVAGQADSAFTIAGHEETLAEVCRLLDGVPLALELAAARVRLVGLEGLRASVESGLALLRTTAPDVPERQRALASTIAWSHDRLEDGPRRLCRRLVVFEQAFTLEAVEAVSADLPDVIDGLADVMEAGLIRPVDSRVRIGFVMPATVRAYVRGLVAGDHELDPARLALAGYLLDNVSRWQPDLDRQEGQLALARFLDVGGDVLASIEACLRLGRIDEGVRLTLASGPFWIAAGELRPGLARTLDTLQYVARDSESAGRLHSLAGQLIYHLTDYDGAIAQFERAIAVAEPLADEATVASSRCFYGASLLVTGEVERGTELARLGAEAAGRLGLYPLVAEGLGVLAISHAVAGDFDNEREMHLARLAVAREHGDVARTADALSILAEIALDEADAATARSYAEEAFTIAHPALPMEAREALITLARSQVAEADLTTAAETLDRAFEAATKIGQTLAIAQCYRVAGCLAAARGRATEAVRLYAAAQRLAPSPNGTDDPVEGDLAGGLDLARSTLGPDAFGSEWTLGTSLPPARVREVFQEVVSAAV